MKPINLDARLSRVADMVPDCGVCADVGADHGYLSAKLLEAGRVKRMYICDISMPSLEKAQRLFEGDALAANARFCVCDGLELVEEPLDACVIAGMGADAIIGILERGWERVRGATLVLQPNLNADRLRRFLYDRGFALTNEELIFDGRWWYPLMQARALPGAPRPSDDELMVGPLLLERRHPLLPEYARRQVRILRKAIENCPARERAMELSRYIKVWEEIAAWQR